MRLGTKDAGLVHAFLPKAALAIAVSLGPVAALAADPGRVLSGPEAVAVVLAPLLLAAAVGRRIWPERRWYFGPLLAALTATSLWVSLALAASIMWTATICGSQAVVPATAIAIAVFVAGAAVLSEGADDAMILWPASAVAGVAVLALALAAGPHYSCST